MRITVLLLIFYLSGCCTAAFPLPSTRCNTTKPANSRLVAAHCAEIKIVMCVWLDLDAVQALATLCRDILPRPRGAPLNELQRSCAMMFFQLMLLLLTGQAGYLAAIGFVGGGCLRCWLWGWRFGMALSVRP